MNTSLTTAQFNKLLHMAISKYGLNPASTYVEFTWWNNMFRPLTWTDCDRDESKFIMLFGDTLCSTRGKSKSGQVIPTGFWICKDAWSADQVVHRPLTAQSLVDSQFMLSFDTVGFLFANSPINYWIDINPFKTRVYKNNNDETILSLYAEDRDSGEWHPFSNMTPDSIKLILEQ